jgi:type II secretory pathway component PulK
MGGPKLNRSKPRKESKQGIALFILLASLMLISFALKELFQLTNTQAEKVRYQYDYLQAIYLARSAQNLSRFFIILDERIAAISGQRDQSSDSSADLWSMPVALPIPADFLKAISGQAGTKDDGPSNSQTEDFQKQCQEFFSDFPGDATSQVEDLNRKLNLNDLNDPEVAQTLIDLLSANREISDWLQAKNISPTDLVREIRDYMDQDQSENDLNSPEDTIYRTLNLPYEPKNYAFTNLDELKMVPSVDDEIFDFLSRYVSAVHIAQRRKPARININTVSRELFQALLKGVSDPEKVTEDFFKDLKENKTVYTEANAAQRLSEKLGIDPAEIRGRLITGASDAFKIETTAYVNQVQVVLETIVGRGYKKPLDPLSVTRISP